MIEENENITKTLIKFSIPLILSGLLQQMFNWADAFIVGNTVGEAALAAVGSTAQISNFFIRSATGFTSGVSILAARYYGADDKQSLNKVLGIFFTILMGAYLVFTVLGISFINNILTSMRTPADIFDLAKNYLIVILAGLPFMVGYNIYSAVLRGIGDSRTPFMVVTFAGIMNVLLDYIFVAVFHWGVVGAAAATTLAQVFMFSFVIIYTVSKYDLLRFRLSRGLFDRTITANGFGLALPITIQSVIKSFGNLVLQNFMNGFGTRTVAAITTAYRVDSVAIEPVLNLGTGVSTLTSQSIGAQRPEKAKKYLSLGVKLMASIAIILTAFIMLMGERLISMFGTSRQVSAIGGHFFRCLSSFYVFYALSTAFRCFLDGTGDVVFTGIVITSSLGVRIVLSHLLAPVFGNMVIAYAEGISWCIMLVLYYIRYRRKFCKTK